MTRVLMYDPYHDCEYGAQRSMLVLAAGLRERGYEPVVVTGREGVLARAARREGVAVEVVPVPERIDLFGGRALAASAGDRVRMLGSLLGYALRIARFARERDVRVLYANDLRSVLILSAARVMLRRPLVWYVRGGYAFGALSAFAARVADRIVLISGAAAKALPEGVRQRVRAKTLVNYIGIDLSRYPHAATGEARRAIRRRLGLPEEGLLVTSVGSVNQRKGFDTLLTAFARVLPGAPAAHLAIAGSPQGAGGEEFLARLVEQGRGLPVTFLGWLDDVRDLLAASDVFVLASREEGLGRVILEAMATGLPPVVTYAGGSEETVVDGESGLVVHPDQPAELAAALERLLADPELRLRMGEAARRRCAEVFSVDAYVRGFAERVLEPLSPQSRPPRPVAA